MTIRNNELYSWDGTPGNPRRCDLCDSGTLQPGNSICSTCFLRVALRLNLDEGRKVEWCDPLNGMWNRGTDYEYVIACNAIRLAATVTGNNVQLPLSIPC